MDDTLVNTQAKNLTKAIFQHESGMDYNAKGDGGTSSGAGQWQPDTWKAQAKDVLGDENAPMTPENQSVVAQGTIRKLIKQGKNAAQIAAYWNSGHDTNWETKVGTTNINGQQIKYNVPKYVKEVTDLYQQYKNGYTADASSGQSDNRTGIQKVGDKVNSIFPGGEIGAGIGTLIARDEANRGVGPDGKPIAEADYSKLSPEATNKLQSEGVPTTAEGQRAENVKGIKGPSAGQLLGDAAQIGLMVAAPGAGEGAGLGTRLATQTAVGAGYGATNALANGKTNAGDILKSAGGGALAGGVLGGLGEVVSGLANKIPKAMLQGKFEGLTDAEAQKFLKQKIGTKQGLLNQSQKILETEGNKIDNVLKSYIPSATELTIHPIGQVEESVQKTVQQFPEYEDKIPKLVQKIKGLVSNNANIGEERATILGYIDKIVNGEANIFEKNQVRKVLDKATTGGYSKLARAIAPSAGHDLAMTFAGALRDEIKTAAPETIPMFDEMQKSIHIRNSVRDVANKKTSGGVFRYSDIIPFVGGSSAGGPLAGLGTVLANRAAENPVTRFAGAKLSKGLLGVTAKGAKASRLLLPGILGKKPNGQ